MGFVSAVGVRRAGRQIAADGKSAWQWRARKSRGVIVSQVDGDAAVSGEKGSWNRGAFESASDVSLVERIPEKSPKYRDGDERDLIVYLPGIDGQGGSISNHVDALAKHFQVYSIRVESSNRSDWDALVEQTYPLLRELADRKGKDQVVIIGESAGGIFAFHFAKFYPQFVKHMVLMNPATCYARSSVAPVYEQISRLPLPDAMYGVLPYVSIPLLVDPVKLGMTMMGQLDKAPDLARGLMGFGRLADIIPAAALKHRLNLLRRYPVSEQDLRNVQVPTTAIVTDNDLTMPTLAESERIVRHVPNATRVVLRGGGHTPTFSYPPSELRLGERIFRAMTRQSSSASSGRAVGRSG